MFAIQLAHLAGYKVMTLTSPRNFELCKSLGADAVFNVSPITRANKFALIIALQYNAPQADVINRIKEETNNSLHAALDTIGTADAQRCSVEALASGPGKVVTILPITEEMKKLREDIDIICAYQCTLVMLGLTHFQSDIVVYTANGMEFEFRGKVWPVSQEDKAHMVQFLAKVPELVQTGKIKPNPTKLFEGGLDGINTGFKYMMEGKNSGEKIVYWLCG